MPLLSSFKKYLSRVFFFYIYEQYRKSVVEDVRLSDFLAPQSLSTITIAKEPFFHIVIDSALTQEAYQSLDTFFKDKVAQGMKEEKEDSSFIAFSNVYGKEITEGYLYNGPEFGENKTLDFLFSKSWIFFLQSITRRPLSYVTSLLLHHHLIRDSTWAPHTDHEQLVFNEEDRLPNGVLLHKPFSHNTVLYTRSLAMLIYVNNDLYEPGKGGGTVLYNVEDMINGKKVVEPINNRILIFEITKKSYHGFEKNLFPRSSVAQWFYSM